MSEPSHKHRFRESIARHIFKYVIVLFTLLGIFTILVQTYLGYQHEKEESKVKIERIAHVFEPILAKALWNFDEQSLQLTLKSLTELPYISGMRISTTDQNLSHGQTEFRNELSFEFKISHLDDFGKEHDLGIGVIYSDTEHISDNIEFGVSMIITNTITLLLCLWIIFWAITRNMLTRPLRKLHQTTQNIDFDRLDHIHLPAENKGDNEITSLENAFRAMIIKLLDAKKNVKEVNQHLEDLVKERTEALEMEISKRKAAQELAETSNQAKSQFLATMSHELRTPLNAVLGMSSLLIEKTQDADDKKILHSIQSSGEHLLQLINDLLDFSKFEDGAFKLAPRPMNVAQVFIDLSKHFTPLFQAKGLSFSCPDPSSVNLHTVADPLRFKQVLYHILDNALKFTIKGGVKLNLEHVIKNENIEFVFCIEDTGIGIEPEKLNQIFQSLTQVDGSSTRSFGGLGLGLTLSQRIIEVMGGYIAVDSEKGKGTTVLVSLRLPASEAPAKNSYDFQLISNLGELLPLNILVVDDNKINQKVLKKLLSKMSYDCDTAINGLEACQKAEQQHYHLIFMDIDMPIMNGLEASDKIAEIYDQKATLAPLIVTVSANIQFADDEHLNEHRSIIDHLNKPVELSQLQGVITKWGKQHMEMSS